MTKKMFVCIIKTIVLAQFHQYCTGRLTGFEGLELGPRSPQPPCDRAASPDGVLAAGTQMSQLDFADPPEAITAQLLEAQRQEGEEPFPLSELQQDEMWLSSPQRCCLDLW